MPLLLKDYCENFKKRQVPEAKIFHKYNSRSFCLDVVLRDMV